MNFGAAAKSVVALRRFMALSLALNVSHVAHVASENSASRSDPFQLADRFVRPHMEWHSRALAELKAGRKQSHWSWFIFVTPEFRDARGNLRGSSMNQYYALRSDDEACAFLKFERDGVNLRLNYLEIMRVVADKLEGGTPLASLVGPFDVPKLRSSVTYFRKIAEKQGDKELLETLERVARRMTDAGQI